MNRKKCLLLLSLLVVLVVAPLLLLQREVRQAQQDRALITAIKQGDAQEAIALLNAGADANAKNTGDKPLTARELVAQFWQRLFHRSSQPENEQVKPTPALLLLLSDDFLFPDWSASDPSGAPAGRPSSQTFHLDPHLTDGNAKLLHLLTALIDHGADVNSRGAEGNTALKNAVDLEYHKGVCLLLERGANPNIADNEGQTPLFGADLENTKLLVVHGAKINYRDQQNDTPLLHICSNFSDYEPEAAIRDKPTQQGTLTRFLLQQGADPNIKDNNGNTPLVAAIGTGQPVDFIQALLETHANPNDEAILNFSDDAPGNATAKLHTTPLISAVMDGDTPIARLLLKHGANVNARTEEGNMALRSAENSSKGKSAIPLLKHYGAKE